MKYKFIAIAIAIFFASCKGSNNIKSIDTIKGDTLSVDSEASYVNSNTLFEITKNLKFAQDQVDELTDSIYILKIQLEATRKTKDSLVKVNSINKEARGVAEYKLLRIREYNRIAAQGNNIKFLRGWINRTLKN